MSQEEEGLKQAITLIKAGKKSEAVPILKSILKTDRNNERAWLWLSFCVDKPEDKIFCYQQVLRINPNNEHTRIALEQLEPNQTPQPITSKDTSVEGKKYIPILILGVGFIVIILVVLLGMGGIISTVVQYSSTPDYHRTETYIAPYYPVVPTEYRPATRNPNLIQPGTYIVGKDIQPGTYEGQAGSDVMHSCYWARLSNLSGENDIITNDNSIGQFYIEVMRSDLALETECELIRVGS